MVRIIKKILIIGFILYLLLVAFRMYFDKRGNYDICVSDKYLVSQITDIFHTVSYRVSPPYAGYNTVIKGRIEGYNVVDGFIIGYLTTRYFDQYDEKNAAPGDKEGYFIVNMKNDTVISGLSVEEYKKKTPELGIDYSRVIFKELSPFDRLSCLNKNSERL